MLTPAACRLWCRGFFERRLRNSGRRDACAMVRCMNKELGVSVALADEVCYARVCLCKRRLVGQEDDPKMLRSRLLAESGSVDDHDMLLPY